MEESNRKKGPVLGFLRNPVARIRKQMEEIHECAHQPGFSEARLFEMVRKYLIDLQNLGDQMETVHEQALANQPPEFRNHIDQLEDWVQRR